MINFFWTILQILTQLSVLNHDVFSKQRSKWCITMAVLRMEMVQTEAETRRVRRRESSGDLSPTHPAEWSISGTLYGTQRIVGVFGRRRVEGAGRTLNLV